MKAIKFEHFTPNLKSVAEHLWGTVDTVDVLINPSLGGIMDSRFFSFGCSSHGGFLVDSMRLTTEEREAIKIGANVVSLTIIVGELNGISCVVAVGMPNQAFTFRSSKPYQNLRSSTWDVWAFEEDEMWAVVSHKLGLYLSSSVARNGIELISRVAKETFESAFPEIS